MNFEINHEKSPKEEVKRFYDFQMQRHLESYDLDLDDLQDKEILDVAAGDDLVFPISATMAGIDNVYSIEPKRLFPPVTEFSTPEQPNSYQEELNELRANIPPQILAKTQEKHVRAKVENLPFKDESFDLIVSRCAMPIIFFPENKEIAHKAMDEILRVLKKNGEVRFFPLQKEVFLGNEIPKKFLDLKKHTDEQAELSVELLDKLQKANKIKYEIKTVNESEIFYDPDIGGIGSPEKGIPVKFIEKVVIITKI